MSHEHEHGPGHQHGHAHSHSHSHERSAAPEAHREPLARGAGAGKLLFFDVFSGIAGDMTIAALVDLGVPFAVVQEAVAALGLPGVELRLHNAFAGAVGVTRFEVVIEAQSGERAYREIDALIARAAMDPEARSLARRIFRRLAEAEARVHRIDVGDVHFHEVGAVDAIVDVVGAAVAVNHLGATVVAAPLPMGRGSVICRHGVLPLPAPATLECLGGAPTYDAGIDAELVTPTGAAIIATIASRYARWPAFKPERVGWGGGTQTLPDRPNALRVVLGASDSVPRSTDAATHVVLEANVDDMTGELAAHALEALLAAGALDAWAQPIVMKKGRPGLIMAALSPSGAAERVAETLLRETTSIGLRRTPVARTERPRRVVEVQTRFGVLPVKISEGPFGPPEVKPEFDACVRAARSFGVSVREVIAEALAAAKNQ